jgi:hypothetical protein
MSSLLITPVHSPAVRTVSTRLVRAQRLVAFLTLSLMLLGSFVPGDAVARAVKKRVKQLAASPATRRGTGPGSCIGAPPAASGSIPRTWPPHIAHCRWARVCG